MPATRCGNPRCGALVTTRYPCKKCGSTEHLEHCHCEVIDPEQSYHWRSCPGMHSHPYTDPDHTH